MTNRRGIRDGLAVSRLGKWRDVRGREVQSVLEMASSIWGRIDGETDAHEWVDNRLPGMWLQTQRKICISSSQRLLEIIGMPNISINLQNILSNVTLFQNTSKYNIEKSKHAYTFQSFTNFFELKYELF